MGELATGGSEVLRDAFAALSRSLKRLSTYRHARDQHLGYLEPALAALNSVTEREGAFTVDVQSTAFVFAGEQVYSEPPREWGLCFRLHRDGVRSLTFRRGLSLDDLMSLCSVALYDPQDGPGREDAVTELWKADLSGIAWTALPGYRMERNETDAQQVVQAVQGTAARARAVLEKAPPSTFADDAPSSMPVLWTEAQRRTGDGEPWTELGSRALLTLLRIVEQGIAGRDQEALLAATVHILDEMVERREPLVLARALEGVRRMVGPLAGDFLNQLGRYLMSAPRLAALVALAAKDERSLPQALPLWLMLLPRDAGTALLEVIGTASSTALPPIARAIVDRAEGNRERFTEALRTAKPEVASVLLHALAGAPLAARSMLAGGGLDNPSPRVRLEAANLIAQEPLAALAHFGAQLSGPDEAIRVVAATALGRSGSERAVELLVAAALRPAFAHVPRDEQAVVYRAIGQLESNAGFDFLCDQLAVRRGLFRKRAAESVRLLAVLGLAEERSPRALKVLEEAASPGGVQPPAVAAAARSAAARLRAAGPRVRT